MAELEKDTRGSKQKAAEDKSKADEQTRKDYEARAARILAADRPASIKLPEGETQGAQLRGTDNRMEKSSAERGELIGMRRGIPIYATAESLYGAPKELAPAVAAQEAIPAKDKAPAQAAVQEKPAVIETLDQQRAAYQAREAPRAAAMQVTPESRTYFSPAFAREMDAAREKENALAKRGGAAEVARRETEKAAYNKFESDFVQSTGRENARQQIAAGTASPELIAKYPELNPLRSTAKSGDDDYGKMLSESELETVNKRIFKPSAAPASAAPQAGVPRKRMFARGKRK
jgi:hypothetical protein